MSTGERCYWGLHHPEAVSTQFDKEPRVVVLDFGRKVAEGTPQEIGVNAEVIKVYLGGRLGQ